MPKIHIKNNGMTVETIMVRSILVTLQLEDVPIRTICGGQAVCGQCAVRILSGHRFLSPKTPREEKRLAAMKADEHTRLACQTYAGGDIEIEIVNFGSGK